MVEVPDDTDNRHRAMAIPHCKGAPQAADNPIFVARDEIILATARGLHKDQMEDQSVCPKSHCIGTYSTQAHLDR